MPANESNTHAKATPPDRPASASDARRKPIGRVVDGVLLAIDVVYVAMRARWAERLRTTTGPGPAVAEARARGTHARARGGPARMRLRRAIRWVDRRLFRDENCYRRVLLEASLDRRAAAAPVCLGMPRHLADATPAAAIGEQGGHAWLDDPEIPDVTDTAADESLYSFVMRL